MLYILVAASVALASARPGLTKRNAKKKVLSVHNEEYSSDEPTICYGDDECRGKEVCDMGSYICVVPTPSPIWTTPSPSAPMGCCYSDESFKANDKCNGAPDASRCESMGCLFRVTNNPETDCAMTTTTRDVEEGCCKGDTAKSNAMCNEKEDRSQCERSNSCLFIVDGDINLDCGWFTESPAPTTAEEGCCYGDTAKSNEMCGEKENRDMCERSGKCVFREGADAVCDLPTTTDYTTTPSPTAAPGCCMGDSYKSNDKCTRADRMDKCEDMGCQWFETEDAKDCEMTTTTSEVEVGCCKGDSVKTNSMCNTRLTRSQCDRSSSCHFVEDGVTDVDCVVDSTTSQPGCCYGNPDQSYSQRWMDSCTSYFTERECLFNTDDAGNARCVFEEMNEYMDCSMLWPTTTSTPTEPAGCCKGSSYKAQAKCFGLSDRDMCERKSCEWIVTEYANDCVITTTTSEVVTPSPTMPGCCKADSKKREDMCLARDSQEKCESSSSCVEWISGEDADCSFQELTTTTVPGCCYINPAMAYTKKYQETCIAFGTERECLKLTDGEGVSRCMFQPMGEYEDCAMLWPTTTTSYVEPAGCCYNFDSYKPNDKCARATVRSKCEDMGCNFMETDYAEDCVLTTTSTPETTPSPIEPGCCKGTSKSSNDKCNGIVDNEEKCDARSSCFWIAFGDVEVDCAWKETSPPEDPGCCYGNPDAAYSQRWMDQCKTFGFESECTMLTHDDGTPRCVFELMGEYGDCETVWPTTTTTSTTESPAGCCMGSSYKAQDKCAGLEDQVGCERKECTWLLTETPEDCVMTTTTSEVEPGCCKGTSMSSNEKCNSMVDDADKCNARSSCEWIAFGTLEIDCVVTSPPQDPGCCYGNPAAAYSKRWMDSCKTFATEIECTMLTHDDGTPRCVFELLGEYEDCETVWPTTTSSPTDAPAGCCMGDSYKANGKCAMAMEADKCADKGCAWILTEDSNDCVITTTKTATTETEVGCCKGEDPKSNEMCNQKEDRNSCERSNSCTFIVDGSIDEECSYVTISTSEDPGCCYGDTAKTNGMCGEKVGRDMCERSGKCEFREGEEADCELPTTTSEPWLGAKNEEAVMFAANGENSVLSEAMNTTVSLSTIVLLAVVAMAALQLYKWWTATASRDGYTKLAATTHANYQTA